MPKFFVQRNQIKDNTIEIMGTDVNHLKNVLRAKIGEKIDISDVNQIDKEYICKIKDIQNECILCDIIEEKTSKVESNVQVDIFQGLPKADKMEWIIQKSVELGVHNIIPVQMKRSIVKLDEKDKIKKKTRWQKISEVAAKQCGRNRIPEILDVANIKNICQLCSKYDIVIVAYENEHNHHIKEELKSIKSIQKDNLKIAVVIGPEGGLEQEEVQCLQQSGAKIVTLGKRILRTETVSLHILSIILYELETEEI